MLYAMVIEHHSSLYKYMLYTIYSAYKPLIEIDFFVWQGVIACNVRLLYNIKLGHVLCDVTYHCTQNHMIGRVC